MKSTRAGPTPGSSRMERSLLAGKRGGLHLCLLLNAKELNMKMNKSAAKAALKPNEKATVKTNTTTAAGASATGIKPTGSSASGTIGAPASLGGARAFGASIGIPSVPRAVAPSLARTAPAPVERATVKPGTTSPAGISAASYGAAVRTTPTPSPVSASPVVKTAAAPSPALTSAARTSAPAASPALTTIEVKRDVGFGNAIFMRGQGNGLTWERGLPLICVDSQTWRWSGLAKDPITFKLLINDKIWSSGSDLMVKPGQKLEVAPEFA